MNQIQNFDVPLSEISRKRAEARRQKLEGPTLTRKPPAWKVKTTGDTGNQDTAGKNRFG